MARKIVRDGSRALACVLQAELLSERDQRGVLARRHDTVELRNHVASGVER
jgi:hypothetical protein